MAWFATGGSVVSPGSNVIKRNKDAAEAQQMIELGMNGLRQYVQWMRMQYGASLSIGFEYDTLQGYGQLANTDRRTLESLVNRKQLTGNEKQKTRCHQGQLAASHGAASAVWQRPGT
ncbi:MAG: hypothetical protein IPN53_08820 [Comamonadaceae bacterium]|nr:hypothetical protein [Comamonadaceae bacterium]